MNISRNVILATDSYKASHWKQYPDGTEAMMSYIEARGGEELFFFGLSIFIKDYLMTPFTQADIDEAAELFEMHGEPFNREGWEYILKTYNGFMPVKIKAVPEGTVLPNRNCLATIECNDPKCFWVASYLETALLRGIWYPSTVATNSYECREVIKRYMEETCDDLSGFPFKLHDFGARGVSSSESAMIGGLAHLATGAMGTDTVEALLGARKYYFEKMAGFSIPAAEHSTITSWRKTMESAAYRNMLKQYGGPGKLLAVVSDSYDIFNAVGEIWGKELKEEVINMGGTLVIRPDSGDPASTVLRIMMLLEERFGVTLNSKGYKVLPSCVRVLQGDGVNKASINEILASLKWHKFSAENIAFGMGGALLQQVNRDTYGFAMKCCAIKINGVWEDVFKEAPGKNSKRGRLSLYKMDNDEYITLSHDQMLNKLPLGYREQLETVFELDNSLKTISPVIREYTLTEVRNNH